MYAARLPLRREARRDHVSVPVAADEQRSGRTAMHVVHTAGVPPKLGKITRAIERLDLEQQERRQERRERRTAPWV